MNLLFSVLTTFVITYYVFYMTTSASVSGGDSGEVMMAANELAVAHPPGYPLFVVLYNFLARTSLLKLSLEFSPTTPLDSSLVGTSTDLGGASVARRYNLVSCFLSALGASFITAAAHLWTSGDSAASISVAFIIFLSSTVWTYSIQTEVFALHNFFVALLLLVLVWYEQRPSVLRAGLGAFVCGLALTNQHTSVLMVVPLAAYIALYRQFSSLRSRPISVTLFYSACFVLGLCPAYAFLVWSAGRTDRIIANNENISLVSWGDTATWSGFLHHFLRSDYGTLSLGSQEANYLVRQSSKTWQLFANDCFEQLGGGIFVAFPILGVVSILSQRFMSAKENSGNNTNDNNNNNNSKKDAKNEKVRPIVNVAQDVTNNDNNFKSSSVALAVFLCWAVYTTFFHALSNLPIDQPLFLGVQQRFWMHPFILVAFFAAPGFSSLLHFISSKINFHLGLALRILLPVAVLATQLVINYTSHDEHANDIVATFGRTVLDSMPQNAILLTKGDLVINSVRFVQSIQSHRRDIVVLDQEMMTYPWYIRLAAKKHAGSVVFPGTYYFPNRKETFDMAMFLNANHIAPSVAKERYSQEYRRAFFCYGIKEGDTSVARAGMALRSAGICDEVVRKPQDEPKELKLKDASLYALDLMRSLPDFAQFIQVPDAELEKTNEKMQRRLNVMLKSWNISGALTQHYLANDLWPLTKILALGGFQEPMLGYDSPIRTAPYDKTSWETVAASDLSAAMQRVAFKLHAVAEMQKANHPDLLIQAEESITSAIIFPPESWTFGDLDRVCAPCVSNSEAGHFANEQIRLFNRKPALPCASDTRTVFMCACFAAERLQEEVIRRFPRDTTSTTHRNRASNIQTLMQFAAVNSNKITIKKMTQLMVDSLNDYVKAAKKEKIDPKEINKLQMAATFFEKQLKE